MNLKEKNIFIQWLKEHLTPLNKTTRQDIYAVGYTECLRDLITELKNQIKEEQGKDN
jgi:hypothetical protein